jgi:hypothetical protein
MEGTSENYIPQDAKPDQAVGAEPQPELTEDGAKHQEQILETEPQPELTEEAAELKGLFDIALEKGLDKAVAEAKTRSARIQELFHDALQNNPEWLEQLKGFENI